MKKTLFFLMLAVLYAISGNFASAHSLKTNDGEPQTKTIGVVIDYSEMVPFDVYSLDYSQQTQMIYPEKMLNLPDCEISKLTYYTIGDFTLIQPVAISLAIVEQGLFDYSDILVETTDEVFTGILSASNGKMEIEFDTPFTYRGGNLLVEFLFNQPQDATIAAVFYSYYDDSYYRSITYYYDDNGTFYADNSLWDLPVITITYEPLSCSRPLALAVDQTETSFVATWQGIAGTSYEVEWGMTGFEQGTGTTATVTTPTYTFPNPLPDHGDYDFYVRTLCSEDTIAWTKKSFSVAEHPIATPFTINFDDEDPFWIFANYDDLDEAHNAWHYEEGAGYNSEYGLFISNDEGVTNAYDSYSMATVYAMRDIYFTPAEGYELSFDWRCYGEIGYDFFKVHITSPEHVVAQIGGSTELDGVLINPERGDFMFCVKDEWQHTRISLPADYSGKKMRLYFVWKNDNFTSHQPPAAIDNISIAHFACADAQLTELRPLSSNELRMTFESAGDYEIAIATENIDPDSTTGHITISNTNTYLFTNLEADSTYFIYVKKLCGDEEAVNWINHTITMPRSILTVPFTIDFEDADINAGFGIANNDNTDYPNNWYIGDAQAFESDHALYISDNGGESATYQTEEAACVVYAYQDVYFPLADSYTVSLDVKVGGEAKSSSALDGLIVFINDPRPTHAEYGNDDLIWENIYSIVGYDNIPLLFQKDDDIGFYISSGYVSDEVEFDTTWNHYIYHVHSFEVDQYAGKVQRLYLAWFNDDSYGTQPSVIVDNISITAEGIVEPVTPGDTTQPVDPIVPGDTTSISDRNLDLDVLLYPNPTTDVLHISAAGYQQYEIFNFVGQNLLRGSFTDGAARISTANLTPGVYFVRLDGRTTRKFVKR